MQLPKVLNLQATESSGAQSDKYSISPFYLTNQTPQNASKRKFLSRERILLGQKIWRWRFSPAVAFSFQLVGDPTGLSPSFQLSAVMCASPSGQLLGHLASIMCLRESVPWKGQKRLQNDYSPDTIVRCAFEASDPTLPFPLLVFLFSNTSVLISKASECRLGHGLGTPAQALNRLWGSEQGTWPWISVSSYVKNGNNI